MRRARFRRYIEDSWTTKPWLSGHPAPPAIKIPSTTSRRMTCEKYESKITPHAASTSVTAMPPGGEGLNKGDPTSGEAHEPAEANDRIRWGSSSARKSCTSCGECERMESDVQIYGGQKTISCPGRERTNAGRAGFAGTYKESCPGGNPAWVAKVGDIADRCCECGSLQPDRAAIETGVAVSRRR